MNNLQQKIEKLDNGGFIPTGLGFPTQLKIEDVRSLKYQYISRDNPSALQIQEAHNKLLSASSSNLYTVTVVHDFKIQFIKQFLTKEDAEKLFIEKCLYYYNEDGLEAFALTKDKALKDFDVKDFEEYFQSEQWNDCCDIANVEINIM